MYLYIYCTLLYSMCSKIITICIVKIPIFKLNIDFMLILIGSEVLSTDDSDTEEVIADPLPIRRQRSHNRSMCMLCSVNEHVNRSTTRNRKVSSSSLRRCRTGNFKIIFN